MNNYNNDLSLYEWVHSKKVFYRHCEERSDKAISKFGLIFNRLLRQKTPRNDEYNLLERLYELNSFIILSISVSVIPFPNFLLLLTNVEL